MGDSNSTSESKFIKWITRFVVIPIIVALVGISFSIYSQVDQNINSTIQNKTEALEILYGAYCDFVNGKKVIQMEKIVLTEIVSVDGQAEFFKGYITADKENIYSSRRWEITGFRSREHIVIAYVSDGKDKSYGLGTLIAKRGNRNWKGKWDGRETESYTRLISCSYIISTEKWSSEEIKRDTFLLNSPIFDIAIDTTLQITKSL